MLIQCPRQDENYDRSQALQCCAGFACRPAFLTFISLFLAEGKLLLQANTALADTRERARVSLIAVAVNKAVVVRLSKKATKVAVTQPKIAEVEVVAPNTLLIHGRAVGATSLVVLFEEKTKAPKQ